MNLKRNSLRPGSTVQKRSVIGVLPGWQVFERAVLRNYLGPLLYGIRSSANKRGCDLLLACGVGQAISVDPLENRPVNVLPAWPVKVVDTDFVPVGPWNTDGLIVINPLMSESRVTYIRGIMEAGHPVVFIGTALGGPAIGIDNAGGIRQAVQHLMDHGHRSIAFIAGIPDDISGDSGDRLAAYLAAVKDFNLARDPRLVQYGFHSAEGGQHAMQEILDSGVPFTAIMSSSDEAAFGAITAIKGAGLRIPGDVAIIGFDDQPESVTKDPPITSVHSLTFERGYRALEMLLDEIEGKSISNEIVKIPTRLAIRQSCGCSSGTNLSWNVSRSPMEKCHDLETFLTELAVRMANEILTEVRLLSTADVHVLCRRLTDAFLASLENDDPIPFRAAVDEAVSRADAVGDDAHVWLPGFSTLRACVPALLLTRHWPISSVDLKDQAEDMLHEAIILINRSTLRHHRHYVRNQRQTTDSVAMLASQLLSALDEQQIYEILAQHLQDVHINCAAIAIFESDGDTPMAWSELRAVSPERIVSFRFRSYEFPPKGLYPGGCPVSLALLPLKFDDVQVGYAAFDATNLEVCGQLVYQLAAALKIARLYREATEGRQMAEEANRLKSRFLSTTSHELRTPLNLIIGMSEMILREKSTEKGSLPEPYQQDVEHIHASAQLLDSLIRDVLDLSRSEVNQLRLVCEPLDLNEVLDVACVVGEQLTRQKGLIWRVERPQWLPHVWGDRTRLRQIVLNLINNAVKFTTQGEVVLKVDVDAGQVILAVEDTGLGIPPKEQGAIFDEFHQSERTTARGYGGLGLGLAICKRLVELHGGQIGVRSVGEEGAGSTFFFSLPVYHGPIPDLLEAAQLSSQSQKILLLTNRAESGQTLCAHLVRQGFLASVLIIDECGEWLARLLADVPSAVALDAGMASEQGWDILKVIKGNPRTQNIPVLFYSLTPEASQGSVLVLDYLTKPIGALDLAQALERQGLAAEDGKEPGPILVVDDEPGILEIHSRIVQTQLPSYHVMKAQDGLQALAAIREQRPALILLDLMMPELDGFGVLEAMQEEEDHRNIPVIVLTGQVLTEEDMGRLNRGVAKVLRKGIYSADETLALMETVLVRGHSLAQETQRLVRKAMVYVHDHFAEPLTRDDVARYVGIHSDYLTRLFHQEFGLTFVSYLNRLRVEEAKKLLDAGNKSIPEVAAEVGFSNTSYFYRVFRRETGIAPGAYQHRSS